MTNLENKAIKISLISAMGAVGIWFGLRSLLNISSEVVLDNKMSNILLTDIIPAIPETPTSAISISCLTLHSTPQGTVYSMVNDYYKSNNLPPETNVTITINGEPYQANQTNYNSIWVNKGNNFHTDVQEASIGICP